MAKLTEYIVCDEQELLLEVFNAILEDDNSKHLRTDKVERLKTPLCLIQIV
jgi:hypothetical protein